MLVGAVHLLVQYQAHKFCISQFADELQAVLGVSAIGTRCHCGVVHYCRFPIHDDASNHHVVRVADKRHMRPLKALML